MDGLDGVAGLERGAHEDGRARAAAERVLEEEGEPRVGERDVRRGASRAQPVPPAEPLDALYYIRLYQTMSFRFVPPAEPLDAALQRVQPHVDVK